MTYNNTELPKNWRIFDSADAVADFALKQILAISKASIEESGAFHLVTAGGTTPLQIYRQLALLADDLTIDWSKWHIYMGDERCLPVDDLERNSLALQQAWLNNSPIPKQNQHFMLAELGAEQAALLYERVVEGVLFDLVLLGMGEDGHTASLFPGRPLALVDLEQARLVQAEYHSPKPPSERVTLSLSCLSNSKQVIKLITGESKRQAIKQWLEGDILPIQQIEGQQTQVLISVESLSL